MKRLFVVYIVIAALLTAGCATLQVDRAAMATGWSAVQALSSGTRVRLVLDNARPVRGFIVDVSDQAIRLRVGQSERRFERARVRQLRRLGTRQTAKQARLGALIGAAAGMFVFISGQPINAFGLTLAVEWIGLGAGLGALGGHGSFDETLIYTASGSP